MASFGLLAAPERASAQDADVSAEVSAEATASADLGGDQSAAILATQAGEGVEPGTAESVGRMVRARLDGLDVVQASTGVALDLSEIQLALGCAGETAECLGPVANELSVRFLVIPHLDQVDSELMLTLALFDRQNASITRVIRRTESRSTMLDAVDGQLRELFGLPEIAQVTGRVGADPIRTPPPPPPPSEGPGAGSFVFMAIGAVAAGVGVGMAVAFLEAEAEWSDARPMSAQEVMDANASFERAETFALTADILLGAGGGLFAIGLIWLIADVAGSGGSGSAHLVPILGPTTAGVAYTEAF